MSKLKLQLHSEEIPARMQEPAAKAFAEGLGVEKYFFSPHFIIIEGDLPDTQADENIERKGPKIGAAEQALNGFMKSCGVANVDELEERDGYYYFSKQSKGEPTKDYLAKKIPEILGGYTWPKSMRWGEHDLRWVRPLHEINCEFGGEIVEFKLGHIQSTINNQQSTIINQEERKNIIIDGAKALHAGVELDERLLNEVTNLVENPIPMMGEFDSSFLDVPQECLVTSMKSHQKYFPVYENEKLINKFIFVANLKAEDGGKKIVAGNERVLKARLSDAKFFWEQDRKHKLEEFLPKLKLVTFHNKIGNMFEKAERISELSGIIAKKIGADVKLAEKAGLLCKADLVSEMVGEFADLQGIMGGYYAENAELGEAIKQHYGEPSEPIAICVALADRIDSLTQLWAAGEKPTGSRDPFGLRRAALGIIRIILNNKLNLNLKDFISDDEVFAFLTERLKYLLKSKNIKHDIVDAVLGQGDDFLIINNKAEILAEFLQTESGKNMLAAYNRAVNILTIEEKKDGKTFAPNPVFTSFELPEEKDLFSALNASEEKIKDALANENYEAAMQELACLQAPLNKFFDNVVVNSDMPEVRGNRLRLLAKIRLFMDLIADFSKVEG